MMPAGAEVPAPVPHGPVLSSPLFPQLLEVYRADCSSSYMDEETYYEACRFYRRWLKSRGNPYIAEKKKKQKPAYRR